MKLPHLDFDNRFTAELDADADLSTHPRQVNNGFYSWVAPTSVRAPTMRAVSADAAALIDLKSEHIEQLTSVMAGNQLLPGMQPHAMNYGGHQFGQWAGQLGDGRAINLGEVLNKKGQHWALQLKGAGLTPYSRSADGLAVLRSSIREFLCSEAMFHLGVPTTRALCLATSGEEVERDMLYDGHPAMEPGAIVCRMAPSFLRFGNFELLTVRKQTGELRKLANFCIRHYFGDLCAEHDLDQPEIYTQWFKAICSLTAKMIVEWMRVGFVHGVMNTDNMSILGLTIDYGPYGWLDNYDPEWTPNTTDEPGRRYRFEQQANVALWNLYQLANAIYPLVGQTEPLESALEAFQSEYQERWQSMMAQKLGLREFKQEDQQLFADLESLLTATETDMTIFYRQLATEPRPTIATIEEAFYNPASIGDDYRRQAQQWFTAYHKRLDDDDRDEEKRRRQMNSVNPKYVFRNYLAQQVIDKAHEGDYQAIADMLEVLQKPYDEQTEHQQLAAKRPDWARNKVGCSALSCSS